MKEFNAPKHVALVIRLLGGRSGGAERIYCELANLLAENGYNVTCLHFDTTDAPPFYPLDSKVELINLQGLQDTLKQKLNKVIKNIPFLPKDISKRIDWYNKNDYFISQLKDYFLFSRPDIAISLMPPANTPTLLAAKGTSVKVIATNHNVPKEDYHSPYRWDPNPIDRELRLKALDYAAAIHVLFPSFGEWFPSHLHDRIVAIPNYVSMEFKRADQQRDRDNLILAVGRLAPVKNYMQLLNAWSLIADEFPNWSVLLYGTGPQKRELKSRISELGMQDSFVLGGHRKDLGSEYSRASIFCHPALFEGFGLSPAEALFLQTPVISYADCPGVNQFVKNGVNGLAIQRDSDGRSLANALRSLIIDSERREELGRNGPPSVAEFSYDRYRSSWINLIERLSKGTENGHA